MAERPFGTVIGYIIQLKETFPPLGFWSEKMVAGSKPYFRYADNYDEAIMLLECRGLVFDKTGRLISRPFHKFFNMGEREETFFRHLDLMAPHYIQEKLDGSMVRPIMVGERDSYGPKTLKYEFKMGTRMGVTDVAGQADEFIVRMREEEKYNAFFGLCHISNVTPIFEWCSRQNRVVIDHPSDRLVLLAVRDNYTGKYMESSKLDQIAVQWGLDLVKRYAGDKKVGEILEEAKTSSEKMEGWVVTWPGTGVKIKVKLDTYVSLHKAKEAISREKYVIEAVLDGIVDDLKSKLQDEDRERVQKFENSFQYGVKRRMKEVQAIYNYVRAVFGHSKKDFALNMDKIPGLEEWMRPIIFDVWNERATIHEALVRTIRSRIKSQPDIDANRSIWYHAKYVYGSVENVA